MPRIRTNTPTARIRWSRNLKTGNEKKDAAGNTIREADGSPKVSYGATLLIDKQDPLYQQVHAACEEAAVEFFKDKLPAFRQDPNFKWPIRDGGHLNPRTGAPHHGDWCYFINCSSNEPVQVVSRYMDAGNPDPNMKTKPRVIHDQTEYYDGMFCKASITFKGFNKGGGFGVAAYLNSVQMWHEGDRLDNRTDATDEFDAEGGEAEMPAEAPGQAAPANAGYAQPAQPTPGGYGQQPQPAPGGYGQQPPQQDPNAGYGAPQGNVPPGGSAGLFG